MYENFGNVLLIIFTISKIDFTIKQNDFRPGAGTRDAGCRVPGVLLPRGNGFSVLRISTKGPSQGIP